MFIHRPHIHIPWIAILFIAPFWAGVWGLYLTVWCMVAFVKLAAWAIHSSVATYQHQPRPAMPIFGKPGQQTTTKTPIDISELTWRDAQWWRTPVRDLMNRSN